MSKKFDASMFAKIKDTLSKSSGGSRFENVMKFVGSKDKSKPNIYVLKLLPILEEGKAPLFHFFENGFTSKKTNKYMSFLALETFDQKDPITEVRWTLYNEWKKANPNASPKEFENPIKNAENWYINALVVKDPVNPENNGQVKILKIGRKLKTNVIDLHTDGAKSDEFGYNIFVPTAGFDLKMLVTMNGEFPNYDQSFFAKGTPLTEAECEEVYERLHDLEAVFDRKTEEELRTILDEHFFVGGSTEAKSGLSKPTKSESPKPEATEPPDEDDEIPMDFSGSSSGSDTDVDDLLAGLDLD